MQSHIRKVHACLAVTCHLHFWQNDRGLLCAIAVTRGWNGYQNKSQHRKLTLEKKILPPLLQWFEPVTFRSWVWHSNHWAIPAPQMCAKAHALISLHRLLLCKRPMLQCTLDLCVPVSCDTQTAAFQSYCNYKCNMFVLNHTILACQRSGQNTEWLLSIYRWVTHTFAFGVNIMTT